MKKQLVFGSWEFKQLITDIIASSIDIFTREIELDLSEEKQEKLFDKLEHMIKFKIDNLEEFEK